MCTTTYYSTRNNCWPLVTSKKNYVLTDYLEAWSVKCPTSSKTVGRSSQIKNQATYNRCHIKLISYLTAAQRPSDDGVPIGCYHVTTDDRRLVEVSIFWCTHCISRFKLHCFAKTLEDWKHLDYVHLRIFESTEWRNLKRLVSSFWWDPVEPHWPGVMSLSTLLTSGIY